MIAKTKANSSFRGTTKYVIEKAQAKIIGGNMIGQTTNQLVAQFMVSRNLNPKVKEPCYHLMLSLPHHETLSDEQFASLGERHFATVVVLSQLTGDKAKLTNPALRLSEGELNSGVDKFLSDEIHQYSFFIARHSDQEHDHIHIVASRINEITTKVIKTWKQYPQSEWSARLLEKRFGLEQIPCSWESKTKALTRNQRDRLARDGLPGAEIMRRAIDEAAIDQPTMPVLIERLAQKGIMAEVSYHSNSQVRGIRFSINVGEVDENGLPKLLSMTGGGLNRHKYSFPKLQSELGISYIPSRDDLALRATVGNAQKLLSASPIINISQTNSTEFQARSHPETESSQKLEQLQSKISRTIDAAAANQPTFTQFTHRLKSLGINPRVLLTRTGKIQGISFVLEGEEFSGTSLGANYSFKGLQRAKGVDFDLSRDAPSLAAIAYSNSKRKSAIQNLPTERRIQLIKENQYNLSLSGTGLGSAVGWQPTESEDTAGATRRGRELHPEKRFSSEMGKTGEGENAYRPDRKIGSLVEREKEQVESLPPSQSFKLKKHLYRLTYQQLAQRVRAATGFENRPNLEVDIGVAMLGLKELRDPNEVGFVLTQSDQVLEWKKSLSSAEYKAKAEDYIESTYQQAVELRETLKQQQLRQQLQTSELEIE